LALVLVLQFAEGLTDRQAAEAVRERIDFKYALGLDLADPGFDFSVLSEFKDRLAGRMPDGECCTRSWRRPGRRDCRPVAARPGPIPRMCSQRLSGCAGGKMVAETLRSALNAPAKAAPD
jgi:hypothetical protein